MRRIPTLFARPSAVAASTAVLLLATGLGACSSSSTMTSSGPRGVATLAAKSGSSVAGTVTFSQQGDQVRVVASVSGLKPGQEHGFHVHEKGDCSSGDGMSAGGHFNPAAKPHGHQSGERHAGDLPNLKADANGNATATFESTGITVGAGATDVVGKGLIVHKDPDDYKTQPTGNAGARLACAVIAKG